MVITTDPSHNQFTSLWKAAAAYAYVKPLQSPKVEKNIECDRTMPPERLAEMRERLNRVSDIEAP